MIILRGNLEYALHIAIKARQAEEQKINGPEFESIFVAGLKEVLKAIHDGEHIEVR